VAALLLVGSIYRINFFLVFWRGREQPYDMAARFFTMIIAVLSGLFSMLFILWPAIGGEPLGFVFAAFAVTGSVIAALLVTDSVVHGERTLAGRADTEEAGA